MTLRVVLTAQPTLAMWIHPHGVRRRGEEVRGRLEGGDGGGVGEGQEAGASCTSSFPCSSAGLGYVYAAGSDLLDMLTIAGRDQQGCCLVHPTLKRERKKKKI